MKPKPTKKEKLQKDTTDLTKELIEEFGRLDLWTRIKRSPNDVTALSNWFFDERHYPLASSRILHAFIASNGLYRCFYTDDQVAEVRKRDPQNFFKQPQSFAAHFVPGLIYIGGWWLLALLVRDARW